MLMLWLIIFWKCHVESSKVYYPIKSLSVNLNNDSIDMILTKKATQKS